MTVKVRLVVASAAVLVLGGAALASASITLPPLLPLQSGGATTAVKGEVDSIHVTNGWGDVDVVAGDSTSITQTYGANLSTPSMTETLSNGVLTIDVGCLGSDPETAGLSVDGVLDLVNSCTDNLKIVAPAAVSIIGKVEQGSISTSGINGSQQLSSELGDVTIDNSSSPSVIGGTTSQGTVSLDGVDAGSATLSSEYGNVDVADSQIGSVSETSDEGSLLIKDSSESIVSAVTSRGDVDLADAVAPTQLSAQSSEGEVTVGVPVGTYDLQTKSPDAVLVSGITNDSSSPNHISATSDDGNVTVEGMQPGESSNS